MNMGTKHPKKKRNNQQKTQLLQLQQKAIVLAQEIDNTRHLARFKAC